MKNHREKLVYLSFIIIVSAILIILGLFYYSSSKFKIGDLVYKKNEGLLIGEVQGISLPFSYLVQWQDDSYTDEFVFSIGKISDLQDFEIREALEKQKDKERFDFYSKDVKGDIITSEDLENLSEGKASEIVSGDEGGLSNIRLEEGDCTPSFVCGKWQGCQSEYDLHLLVTAGVVSGIQYRQCKDSKECMADFIDSKTCSRKEEIEIKKTTINGENYLEIYDLKGKIIGSLKETQLENFRKLNIDFVI